MLEKKFNEASLHLPINLIDLQADAVFPTGKQKSTFGKSGYYYALICEKGHVVSSTFDPPIPDDKEYCKECGSKTRYSCINCGAGIQGLIRNSHADFSYGQYFPPRNCSSCSELFPWAKKISEVKSHSEEANTENDGTTISRGKDPCEIKIFISHSERDREIASKFHDEFLIGALGMKQTDILITSLPGGGISPGDEWRNTLRNTLLKAKIIILIVTPNYKNSEVCLNEAGAAWASNAVVLPCYLGSHGNAETVGIVFNIKQATNLENEYKLDSLRDSITKKLGINPLATARYNNKRNDFVKSLNDIVKNGRSESFKSRDVKNSEQKKPINSIADTTSSTSNLTIIGIKNALREAPFSVKQKIADNYIGIAFTNWKGSLTNYKESEGVVVILISDMTVKFTIDANNNPRLRTLKEGDQITINGKVKKIDATYFIIDVEISQIIY